MESTDEKVKSTSDDDKDNKINKPDSKKFTAVVKARSSQVIRNRLFNKIVAFFALCPLVWLLTYLVVGESALPGKGIYFSLIAMVAGAHVVGFVFEIIKMPALLGMLVAGIAFRNVPYVNVVGNAIDPHTSSILRCFNHIY